MYLSYPSISIHSPDLHLLFGAPSAHGAPQLSRIRLGRRRVLVLHQRVNGPVKPVLVRHVQDRARLAQGQAHLDEPVQALVVPHDAAGQFAQHAGLVVPDGELEGGPVLAGVVVLLLARMLLLLLGKLELDALLDLVEEGERLVEHLVAVLVNVSSEEGRDDAEAGGSRKSLEGKPLENIDASIEQTVAAISYHSLVRQDP